MELAKKIKLMLENNEFRKLQTLFESTKPNLWEEELLDITYDTGNLAAYTIICMMLIEQESPKLHSLASAMLVHALCHINGAYASGYYHMLRASILDPKDVGYKEALLFFHKIPDQLLSKKRAIELALEVLEKDPTSKAADDIIKRYQPL
jgi:hypothetical protein